MPLVVYIPNSMFWEPYYPESEQYMRIIKNYARKKNIAFIDASSELSTLGADGYAKAGPHLSPVGYARIGGLINKWIEMEGRER